MTDIHGFCDEKFSAVRDAFVNNFETSDELGAELREWQDADADTWSNHLAPLEQHVAQVFIDWLAKISLPIRAGTHSNSAFALGLAFDWASLTDHAALMRAIEQAALRFYQNDSACPIAYEPSAHDFLSPCLAEADLMRRVLPAEVYIKWLEEFLSTLDADSALLAPAVVSDPTDGHIVHLDGLNLSRAWMMRNIAAQLAGTHPLAKRLMQSAARHQAAGLQSVADPHYAGGHWLGTFAMYLVTERGLQ